MYQRPFQSSSRSLHNIDKSWSRILSQATQRQGSFTPLSSTNFKLTLSLWIWHNCGLSALSLEFLGWTMNITVASIFQRFLLLSLDYSSFFSLGFAMGYIQNCLTSYYIRLYLLSLQRFWLSHRADFLYISLHYHLSQKDLNKWLLTFN